MIYNFNIVFVLMVTIVCHRHHHHHHHRWPSVATTDHCRPPPPPPLQPPPPQPSSATAMGSRSPKGIIGPSHFSLGWARLRRKKDHGFILHALDALSTLSLYRFASCHHLNIICGKPSSRFRFAICPLPYFRFRFAICPLSYSRF